jgi:UDPglucose 6-dehydrogenase
VKVVVVGTGPVGLVVGTCLSETGHFVTCVDKDADRIAQLQRGEIPLHEPGLEELVARNMEEGRLSFSSELAGSVQQCLIILLCVGTPGLPDGAPDISSVMDAVEEIGPAIPGYRVIVAKSTVPVGTADAIREKLGLLTQQPFDVVSNPEFLREGNAVEDFMRPDRIVVGCEDVRVVEIMRELYAPVLRTDNPFLVMNSHSAELAKYGGNVMLAARIALLNELACLSEAYGADIGDIRKALGADSRIGSQYLYPSLGFGGSCLPKDVAACARLARDAGLGDGMLDAVMAANERQLTRFIQRILAFYGDSICEKRLAFWGAAYKARTDDLRVAPALRVIDTLLENGASIAVYDPVAGAHLRERYGDRVTVARKCYDVLDGADGLVVPTEWREFQSPDYDRMAELMREKVVFDGRNLYNPRTLSQYGFRYFSIGRADV